MAFNYVSGPLRMRWYPKTASTVFAVGALTYSTSGQLLPADATSGDHVGVCQKTVAATDSDYASTTRIPVILVGEDTVWEVAVGAGTAAVTLENTFVDLTDSISVDVGSTSKNVFLVTKFISTTVVQGVVSAHTTDRRVATT